MERAGAGRAKFHTAVTISGASAHHVTVANTIEEAIAAGTCMFARARPPCAAAVRCCHIEL